MPSPEISAFVWNNLVFASLWVLALDLAEFSVE